MTYHRFSIIQGRAVTDKRVSNAQLRTLTALGMYADKDGWCFPSQSTIGEDLGKSRQTVNEDIAVLVELGYVEKDSVTLPGNQIRMRYRLLYDSIPTGGVSENRQGVSDLPDSNDPMNDSYNMASGENQPSAEPFDPSTLPIEWQIAAGQRVVSLPNQREAEMLDSANLIAMGCGIMQQDVLEIALAFQHTRNIVLPLDKAKGYRKVAKSMVQQGVTQEHVIEAVDHLLRNNLTCVDLFSVEKVAVSLANPAPKNYDGSIDGV